MKLIYRLRVEHKQKLRTGDVVTFTSDVINKFPALVNYKWWTLKITGCQPTQVLLGNKFWVNRYVFDDWPYARKL